MHPQVRLVIRVYNLLTALKVYVAPVTSGPTSVSQCCVRDRFARDNDGRGTMALNFSSVAPAVTDSVARSCRSRDLGHRQSQLLRFQRLRQRHSCHQLLLCPVTPPPTHHCCQLPSHCLRLRKLDFTCARRAEDGYLEGLYDDRMEKRRKYRGSVTCLYSCRENVAKMKGQKPSKKTLRQRPLVGRGE